MQADIESRIRQTALPTHCGEKHYGVVWYPQAKDSHSRPKTITSSGSLDNEGGRFKLTKSEAITLANARCKTQLKMANTVFSNRNSAVDVWWFQPANVKFTTGFNLLLNNQEGKTMHHFWIPGGAISNPTTLFRQRKGNKSHIEVCINDDTFTDRLQKNVSFGQYLCNKIYF